MSGISTATAASSAAGMFVHGHKIGGFGAVGGSAASSAPGSSSTGSSSTQGLFSSLLQSLEEVAGISTTAAATAAAGTKAVTGTSALNGVKAGVGGNPAATQYTAQAASSGAQSLRAVGANINTSA